MFVYYIALGAAAFISEKFPPEMGRGMGGQFSYGIALDSSWRFAFFKSYGKVSEATGGGAGPYIAIGRLSNGTFNDFFGITRVHSSSLLVVSFSESVDRSAAKLYEWAVGKGAGYGRYFIDINTEQLSK